MEIIEAPDLLTIDDHTRAITELVGHRATGPAQVAIDAAQLADLYAARAAHWDALGDAAFDKGTDGLLVDAAWRCARDDRDLAAVQRDRAGRWSRVAARAVAS